MAQNAIVIKGARQHNLKNIDLTIPRDKLVVITGLSGSGKSSLAFDTMYAEGQRRYVESLSSYARMFLGQMSKPDLDSIDGLSPAVSIDQKTTSRNPRSTVGTTTEIYDYLRLLFARIGVPHCPECGRIIKKHLLTNCIGTLIVITTLQIPSSIFTESFLSFLGLGVAVPMPSLGSLASEAINGINTYPHLLFIPSIVISLIILSFNLLGDGLRDAFDPKLKN